MRRRLPGTENLPRDRKEIRGKERMKRAVTALIATVERSEYGYADVPPGSINDEMRSNWPHSDTRSLTVIDCGLVGIESTVPSRSDLGTIGRICHRQFLLA